MNEIQNLNFGGALVALKNGQKVCRSGWNGKGMFLFLVKASEYQIDNHSLPLDMQKGQEPFLYPWIGMKTADNKIVPWLASQTDVLAEDWIVLD